MLYYTKGNYRDIVFADTSDEVKPYQAIRNQNHFDTADANFYTTIKGASSFSTNHAQVAVYNWNCRHKL